MFISDVLCDPTELPCVAYPVYHYVAFAVVNICHRYQNVTNLNLSGVLSAESLVIEAITFLRFFTSHFLSSLL